MPTIPPAPPVPPVPLTAAQALDVLRTSHRAYRRRDGERFAHAPFSNRLLAPGWTYLPREDRVVSNADYLAGPDGR